jgi:hypothetical protein
LKEHPSPEEELYVFADRFDVPELRKAIIARIYNHYATKARQLPWYAGVIVAFKNLPPSCPLCRLYIDLYVFRFGGEPDEDDKALEQFLPPEFTTSVMNGMGKERRKKEKDAKYKPPANAIKPIKRYDEKSYKKSKEVEPNGNDTAMDE